MCRDTVSRPLVGDSSSYTEEPCNLKTVEHLTIINSNSVSVCVFWLSYIELFWFQGAGVDLLRRIPVRVPVSHASQLARIMEGSSR